MSFKRLWAMFHARNLEFFRDWSALGWNFIFPFLIVAGFGLIFGGNDYTEYKVGVFPSQHEIINMKTIDLPSRFTETRYIKFIGFESFESGIAKLKHHKIDFLVKAGSPSHEYWVSDSSPKGYIVEKIFNSALLPDVKNISEKKEIKGNEVRYIDWLFPGILAMNMMFSALWGVGYIVVRYRKMGVLKRLHATPLTAFEYLASQVLSRIFILVFTLVVVWIGCDLVFHFKVVGSYFDLFIIYFTGGICLSAYGLVIAARGFSEEFTSGVVNFISWPMMFLSEVWFSLEGSPHWIKIIAKLFPLTHMLSAARKVMNDGATLANVAPELAVLVFMTIISIVIGAALFSWNK
ncbi:MAG: ABC transporter permease [Proteobacteria bacterium]|nr:ABC transporter permease [Pseudomonadota bacterium]